MSSHQVEIDPILAGLVSGTDDDDWQHLTHEDVRDLQKLFDFFAAQDNLTLQTKNSGKFERPADNNNVETKVSKSMLTIKGMDRLLKSLGLYIPTRELQIAFNSRKQLIDAGVEQSSRDRYHFTFSDVKGFTYDDFLMFYAMSTKNISTDRELKEVFRFLDDDADGFIELPKAVHIFKTLLDLEDDHIKQLLIQSRQTYPGSQSTYPPHTHSNLESHISQSRMSDEEWLIKGKLSYAEFSEFMMS